MTTTNNESRRLDPAKLRRAREAAGLSREQLAVKSGKSYPTIVACELGTKSPSLQALVAFADALGVKLDSLLTRPRAPR